jgi:hypothetical protein
VCREVQGALQVQRGQALKFSWRDHRQLSLQRRRGRLPSLLALVRSWCAAPWLRWSTRICDTDVS